MLTSAFDFDLPSELIAQRPLPRGESRLMVLGGDARPLHRRFADLPRFLRRGDLLVVNDTRVIPARLHGRRAGTEGRIEILLVERLAERRWHCLLRPGRRARPGVEIELPDAVVARVESKLDDGRHEVRFSEPIEPHLEAIGTLPLPPYIKREVAASDREDYQTIFARRPGAIAAPTAGLHFTGAMRDQLAAAGVDIRPLTLHVGIGTFKPVTAELVHEHRMEAERFEIPADTAAAIDRARRRGGRVVAVGTTVVRTLEGVAAARGVPIRPGEGRTDLFIRPGHRFQVVDGLLTNFHLPRSTLVMLVSALVGRRQLLGAYREAVAERYRFFSYGDAMLALPDEDALGDDGASGENGNDNRGETR